MVGYTSSCTCCGTLCYCPTFTDWSCSPPITAQVEADDETPEAKRQAYYDHLRALRLAREPLFIQRGLKATSARPKHRWGARSREQRDRR